MPALLLEELLSVPSLLADLAKPCFALRFAVRILGSGHGVESLPLIAGELCWYNRLVFQLEPYPWSFGSSCSALQLPVSPDDLILPRTGLAST